MKRKPQRPPVVLLGGLNIVRALGLAGIPVIIASSEQGKPSMSSRYCAGTLALPPIGEREAFVDMLARAGDWLANRYGARVPLFYDNDDRLALVQDCRDSLEPHFALLLNERRLAETLLDKSLFQALAEREGLPVPRRLDWQALEGESGPVLMKPKVRIGWDHSNVNQQICGGAGKARIYASGREARADPLLALLAEQVTFQQYVPGGDDAIWSFHGFAAPGGEVLEWFVGRKVRTFPALTGHSSYLRLARDDAVVRLGRDISSRLQLAGIFKMDFKRSAATGELYLLEINTRFNLWHYLGAASGVNLPRVAYEYLLYGTRPVHREARLGLRWVSMEFDWPAYREARARGELTVARWLVSLLCARKVCDLFAWSDPLPFVRHWTGRLGRLPGRLTRLRLRFSRWLSTAS